MRSYDSATCLYFSVFLYVEGRAYGRVGGLGAKSYELEKAWPSVNHSVFFHLSLPDTVHKGSGHKVHIYLEYHCFCPSSELGPPGTKGGRVHTRLSVRGWGSLNSDLRKSLALCLFSVEWVTKRNVSTTSPLLNVSSTKCTVLYSEITYM